MAYSTQRAVSDGTMAYLDVSIQYMKRGDISVFYNDLPANPATWAWVGTTDKRIAFTPNVPNGVEVLLKRSTQINTIINVFSNGAKFNNATMDQDFTQLLYLNQEAVEGAALTDIFNDVDFHGYKIKNVGSAVDDTDVVSLGQVKTMSNGAYQAQLAAQAAQASAEAARDLAAKWASQLTTPVDGTSFSAKQYALNASTSATQSATSASAAQTAQGLSEAARNSSQGYANAASASAAAALVSEQNAAATAAPSTALIARIDAAEVSVANANTTAGSAVTTANSALALAAYGPIAQCRIGRSGGDLILQRYNGQYLMIGGVARQIPAGGVTCSASGATGGTLYWLYASYSGSTMAMNYSTTVPVVDSTTGLQVKTGDASSTLVGLIYCVTNGTFATPTPGTTVYNTLLNYFNRRGINQSVALSGTAQVDTAWGAIVACCWSDENVHVFSNGYGSTPTSGNTSTWYISRDGGQVGPQSRYSNNTGSFAFPTPVGVTFSQSTGVHTWNLRGSNDGQLFTMTATLTMATNG